MASQPDNKRPVNKKPDSLEDALRELNYQCSLPGFHYPFFKSSVLKEFFSRHNAAFHKSRGQNFLIQPAIVEKMARIILPDREPSEASPAAPGAEHLPASKSQRQVLEIGPGCGALTWALFNRLMPSDRLELVEVDHFYGQVLEHVYAESSQVNVIKADALTYDFADSPPQILCGNLPYSLSTELLLAIRPALPRLKRAAFLLQKEFAERLIADSAGRFTSRLGVLLNCYGRWQAALKVGRGNFFPAPKVDSLVITFSPDNDFNPGQKALDVLEVLTAAFFWGKRKPLSSCLTKSPHFETHPHLRNCLQEAQSAAKETEITDLWLKIQSKRAEEVTLAQWRNLALYLSRL